MPLPARGLRRRGRWPFGTLLLLMLPLAAAAETLERHLQALRPTLDSRVVPTLDALDGTGRQLLAARSYLHSAALLEQRWSWSAAQAEEFERSAGRLALDAAIARVRCEFEAANPGHTLFVNPGLRTLEVQVERWNSNETVARAAERLLRVAREAAAAPGFGAPGSARGLAALRRMLLEHVPEPQPPLAAPGLSRHGRGLAIDFQVQSAGRVVAGPSAESIASAWDAPGWSAKLQAAVAAADVGFTGPLRDPYEPWHFDFEPAAGEPPRLVACRR